MKAYEIFSTTADVGIRVWGQDCPTLCGHAVHAFRELVFGAKGKSSAQAQASLFRYEGDGCENVLVNLLSEVLYLTYEKRRMVIDLHVRQADDRRLEADLLTLAWPCPPRLEIKSVTYHNLTVHELGGTRQVDVVMDI